MRGPRSGEGLSTRLAGGGAKGESAEFTQLKLDLALAARRWRRRARLDDLATPALSSAAPTLEDNLESASASLDALVRSLLASGATRRDIALEIVRNA